MKRKLLIPIAGMLLASSLSMVGCSMLPTSKKEADETEAVAGSDQMEALKNYVSKTDPDSVLEEAQSNIINSDFVRAQFTYKFKFVDLAESSQIQSDTASTTIWRYPNGDMYDAAFTKPDGTSTSEYVYVVPTEEVTKQDGINALNDISETYSKFTSPDSQTGWEKTGTNERWAKNVVASIDFNNLKGAGLELDKGQVMVNDKYMYHMTGTLSWEKATAFIGNLTTQLGVDSAKRASTAKSIEFDAYFYQNCRPMRWQLTFTDRDNLESDFGYSEWTVEGTYGDVQSNGTLTVPYNIREAVILAAREKEQEASYSLGGIAIEMPTEAEVMPETDAYGNVVEPETDAEGNIVETEPAEGESSSEGETKAAKTQSTSNRLEIKEFEEWNNKSVTGAEVKQFIKDCNNKRTDCAILVQTLSLLGNQTIWTDTATAGYTVWPNASSGVIKGVDSKTTGSSGIKFSGTGSKESTFNGKALEDANNGQLPVVMIDFVDANEAGSHKYGTDGQTQAADGVTVACSIKTALKTEIYNSCLVNYGSILNNAICSNDGTAYSSIFYSSNDSGSQTTAGIQAYNWDTTATFGQTIAFKDNVFYTKLGYAVQNGNILRYDSTLDLQQSGKTMYIADTAKFHSYLLKGKTGVNMGVVLIEEKK